MANMHGPGKGDPGRHGFQRPRNTGKTIGRLMSYIGRSRWLLLIVAIGLIGSSALSVAGSYLLKPIINDAILPGDYQKLVKMLVLMATIYVGAAVCSYTYARIMVHISQKTSFALRRDLFAKMQTLPLSYFDTHTHGDLMSRYTNDIETITEIMNNGLANMVSGILTFLGIITVMIVTSPPLFLVTLVCLGLMFVVIMTIGKRSRLYFAKQQKDIGAVNGYIEEMIEGQKVIKVFNHEEKAKAGFNTVNVAYQQSASAAQAFAGAMMPAMGNISYINYALTCCIGAVIAIYTGSDLGTLVMFLQYVRQVSQPISMVSQQMNNLLAAMAGAERIFEILDLPSETDEGKVTLERQKDGFYWKKPDGTMVPLRGDVRFEDVVFSYVPEKTILHKVSLYAKPGQKIAFVGSTGAGKTTITNLINRFYEIDSGTITYDGIDVRDIAKDSLRRSLGIVLQDTHLFTGTIADNIRYGKLDATDEEVIRAAKLANADAFIRHLPQGYNTVITGDGGNLSQGERQLLAIARAAVADPPVLILDEATSSIDTRTEKLIEQGMDSLMAGRTVFVIAHRLSTVRNAKAIMVLELGEIIERGDHNALLAQKGRYYQLYTGQAELS